MVVPDSSHFISYRDRWESPEENKMKKTLLVLFASVAVVLSTGFTPVPDGNQSATGDYVRSNGAHMVINAIKHKDGTTTGSMLLQSAVGQIIIAQVDDVIFIGNHAYIHGRVTYNSFGGTIGNHAYHHVVDNGEGAGDPPDSASPFAFPPNPFADPIATLAGTSPIREGNIQVRSD